jgi:hypothetical protein
MRFMVMHKVDKKMEAGERPDQSIIKNMGQLIGRHLKSGVFKDGAGLHRSAQRARVTFSGGTPSVERGPYAGTNELLAGFAMVSVDTGIEQAIELAKQLGVAAGNREIEVGPVVEGWDLSGNPRPANTPFRYLLLIKADADYEAGAPLPAPARTLLDRWKREGLLQVDGNLKPSKTAKRFKVSDGKRSWVDGPFAESKELVAGYSILEVPSLEDAEKFTVEYAEILGDNEVDIRELA